MDQWLTKFDQAMVKFFAINHHDAGMGATELERYRDLEPREAALTFGNDYDLDRVDDGWH